MPVFQIAVFQISIKHIFFYHCLNIDNKYKIRNYHNQDTYCIYDISFSSLNCKKKSLLFNFDAIITNIKFLLFILTVENNWDIHRFLITNVKLAKLPLTKFVRHWCIYAVSSTIDTIVIWNVSLTITLWLSNNIVINNIAIILSNVGKLSGGFFFPQHITLGTLTLYLSFS